MITELEGYLKKNLSDADISDLPPVHRKTFIGAHRNSLLDRGSRLVVGTIIPIGANLSPLVPAVIRTTPETPVKRLYYDSHGKHYFSYGLPSAVIKHTKAMQTKGHLTAEALE